MGLFGAIIMGPLYVQDVLGRSALTAGLTSLPGGLLMGLAGPMVGRIYDRRGAPRPRRSGIGVAVRIPVGFHSADRNLTVAELVVLQTIAMVGLSMMFTPLMTDAALGVLPDRLYSHGSAILTTLQRVGGRGHRIVRDGDGQASQSGRSSGSTGRARGLHGRRDDQRGHRDRRAVHRLAPDPCRRPPDALGSNSSPEAAPTVASGPTIPQHNATQPDATPVSGAAHRESPRAGDASTFRGAVTWASPSSAIPPATWCCGSTAPRAADGSSARRSSHRRKAGPAGWLSWSAPGSPMRTATTPWATGSPTWRMPSTRSAHRLAVVGLSGGGPYALACGALPPLADRVATIAVLGGVPRRSDPTPPPPGSSTSPGDSARSWRRCVSRWRACSRVL